MSALRMMAFGDVGGSMLKTRLPEASQSLGRNRRRRSVIGRAKRRGTANPWLAGLIARKPTKVAAVALANKLARVAWALPRDGGTYRKPAAAAAARARTDRRS